MYENIFSELKNSPNWVVWRGEKRQDKITKIPYQAGFGRGYKASVTNPKHWTTFNTAVQFLSSQQENTWARESLLPPGIGYVFTEENGILFIDLDHVIEDGKTSRQVAEWINSLGGIAEISPSQTGFHLFVKGKRPGSKKRHGNIEMYCSGRYSTITGNYVTVAEDGTLTPLPETEIPQIAEPSEDALLSFYETAFEEKSSVPAEPISTKREVSGQGVDLDLDLSSVSEWNESKSAGDLSDQEIIDRLHRAKNAIKFSQLYDQGREDLYCRQDGSYDPSAHYCALAMMVAFYAGPNGTDQIFRIVGSSALIKGRPDREAKWERIGRAESEKAIGKMRNFYSPRSRKPKEDAPEPEEAQEGKVVVYYTVDSVTEIIQKIQTVLHDTIYQYGGILVRIVRLKEKRANGDVVFPEGSCVIETITEADMRYILASLISFRKMDKRSEEWLPCLPPRDVVTGLLVCKDWPHLSILSGISNCPILCFDGSVLTQEGYHNRTGLFADFNKVQFPPIDVFPTKERAIEAQHILLDALNEFPFYGETELEREASKNTALAAILTAVMRKSVAHAPMFLFNAPTPGTGKSTLADLVSIIATGLPAPAITFNRNEEEMSKAVFSVLIEGAPVTLIDNITGVFNSPVMNIVLTQQQFKQRILGATKTGIAPTNSLFLGTGNNLEVSADMTRRCLVCTLQTDLERPELRSFARKNFYQWAQAERPRLVWAALTILFAFQRAGRPGLSTLKPFASYQTWSDCVRGALHWLCVDSFGDQEEWGDPLLTMLKAVEDDPIRARLLDVLQAWFEKYGNEPQRLNKVLTEISDDQEGDLFKAFQAVAQRSAVNARTVGNYLRVNRGKACGGFMLKSKDNKGAAADWYVYQLKS